MSSRQKGLKSWQVGIISLAVVAVAAGGYLVYTRFLVPDKTTDNSTQLVAVRYGDISQTLTLSGNLAYFETEPLTFGAGGTIQEVNVAAGASVKKGDVLARLDAASSRALQTAVLNAQIALDTAQVNLNNANHPDTNPQINTAKREVTNTQIALNTSQTNLYNAQHPYTDLQINQAKVAITTARIALNTSQTNLYNAQHPYTDLDIANAQAAVTSAKIAINTTENNLEKVLHPYTDAQLANAQTNITSNQTAITSAQTDLSYVQEKNRIDFTVAWYVVSNATDAYQNATATYGPMSGYSVNASLRLATAQNNLNIVLAASTKALNAAEDKLALAQDKLALAQDTLATMMLPPDPLIVQQKQELLLIAQLNLVTAQDTLTKRQAGPNLLDVQLKTEQLAVAQNNLINAQDNLTKMNAGPDPWDIQLRQEQLLVAQNNLANAKQTLVDQQKALNITLRQLAVDNAKAALEQAKIQSQSTNLTAPFSGTVTSVSIRAGQAVNINTPAIDLAVPSAFGLSALVSQLDISRVNLDQAATLRVDAISSRNISGKIATINNTPITQSGIVSYRVTILVPAPPGGRLRAGMTGTASVIVQEANHVLVVPNKALGGTISDPSVVVMVDNQTQTKSVKTGISDGTYTEITAGLQEGDMLVISSIVKAKSTSTANATASNTSNANSTLIPTNTPTPTGPPAVIPGGGQGGGAQGGGAPIVVPGGGQGGVPQGGATPPVTPGGGQGGGPQGGGAQRAP